MFQYIHARLNDFDAGFVSERCLGMTLAFYAWDYLESEAYQKTFKLIALLREEQKDIG